jgi:hypothetical protein
MDGSEQFMTVGSVAAWMTSDLGASTEYPVSRFGQGKDRRDDCRTRPGIRLAGSRHAPRSCPIRKGIETGSGSHSRK